MSGFFSIGVYQPKTVENIGTLWRSAQNFGASYIFTIGQRYKRQPSDCQNASHNIPLFTFENFSAFKQYLSADTQIVPIELSAKAQMLTTAKHPVRAAYLLGPEDGSIPEEIIDRCSLVLQIPTVRCINVSVAGSIVMYDRTLKAQKASVQHG